MKKFTLSLTLSLIVSFAFAQNEFTLKVYQNTDLYKVSYSNSLTQTTTQSEQINFTRISLALSLQRKKVAHELELFVPNIHTDTNDKLYPMNYQFSEVGSGVERTISTYSFRYGISKQIFQSKKMIFTLGAGANPYYSKTSYISSVSTTYNHYVWIYGVALNIIPRIYYPFSEKIGLDLSIPFKLFDARYTGDKIENPTIPLRQQNSSSWDAVYFESAYTLRLGLCVKL